MQTVLKNVPDERLRAYIVFLPILRPDDRGSAEARTGEFADGRLAYFWDGDRLTGKEWQRVLELGGIAWDVYFLYDPEAQWDTAPPAPDFWMHQLSAARGKAPLLNGSEFESKLKELLSRHSPSGESSLSPSFAVRRVIAVWDAPYMALPRAYSHYEGRLLFRLRMT